MTRESINLIKSVTAQQIKDRIDKLSQEISALGVLLRAARARERTTAKRKPQDHGSARLQKCRGKVKCR